MKRKFTVIMLAMALVTATFAQAENIPVKEFNKLDIAYSYVDANDSVIDDDVFLRYSTDDQQWQVYMSGVCMVRPHFADFDEACNKFFEWDSVAVANDVVTLDDKNLTDDGRTLFYASNENYFSINGDWPRANSESSVVGGFSRINSKSYFLLTAKLYDDRGNYKLETFYFTPTQIRKFQQAVTTQKLKKYKTEIEDEKKTRDLFN